eukprot:PhM_4_TR10013/c2_g2_i1/m.34887
MYASEALLQILCLSSLPTKKQKTNKEPEMKNSSYLWTRQQYTVERSHTLQNTRIYYFLLLLVTSFVLANAHAPATCPFTGRDNFAYKGTCHHVQLAVRINAYATLKPFTIGNAPDLIDTDATYSAKGFTVTATPSVTFIRAQGGTSGITIPGDGSWGGWWVYFLRRKNC